VIPYLMLFGLPAWFALRRPQAQRSALRSSNFQWQVVTFIFTLVIGLRHEVGGDWFIYKENYDRFASGELLAAMTELGTSDSAFAFLSWIAPSFGGEYFVNFVCGALFSLGLVSFCRNQPNPWLALTVAVPYLVTVVAMGYTRQGVAIGLSMLGLVALSHDKLLRFLFLIALAGAFHKSAVILIPLAIFSGSRHRWTAIIGVLFIGSLTFILFLQESLERLVSGYVSDAMESSGALIRVLMNALPAMLFLLLRSRFALSVVSQGFWTWMAMGALLLVPALVLSPSSTAVDRVALYWIPVQIFVWSRLPQAISLGPRSEQFFRQAVIIYSLSVLLVWLLFGDHSFAWIPYKFYPWVVIKSLFSV